MRLLQKALTFDDVLLVPAYSNILPRETVLSTQFTRDLRLNIPFCSAAMDTVTEANLAIALAQEGGIGIIHKNMTAQAQAAEVNKVKRHEAGMVADPITIGPDMIVADVIRLTREHNISGLPVVQGEKVLGMVTHRDLRFEDRMDAKISEIMTPAERLITIKEGATLDDAKKLMHEHRLERVLVVDDEKLIVKGIRFSLEQDGYEVDCAYDGGEAIEMAKKTEYDIVLLDVMLPKHDGFEVCQAIREFSDMPVIMLTAKGSDMDKILGLEYGADDYISKPFNILEVKARIRAIIRRSMKAKRQKKEEQANTYIGSGDLKMDTEGRRVFIGEKEINLTAKEFDLLELLVRNPNKVYSREALLNYVWGNKAMDSGDVRTVDVHVRRLREKIEPSPSDPKFVHTKWGVGYYFGVSNRG